MINGSLIHVWTKGYESDGSRVSGICVKKMRIECVPRKGELIIVHEGWCAEEVLDVFHDLDKKTVIIEIGPDRSSEHAYHIKKHGEPL